MILTRQSVIVRHSINIVQNQVQSKRGLRGVQKVFREKLPQYQVNLRDLPPLNENLLNTEQCKSIEEVRERRIQKLATYNAYIPVKTSKILLEALLNPDLNDIDQLLRLIDENLPTMTSFYLGLSFEVLNDMMRDKLCDHNTIAVSPEFKRLCTRTLYKLRYFEADEVLKLMVCLSNVQISEKTLIFQAGLKMARELINDFDPEELEIMLECLPSKELLGLPSYYEKLETD